MRNIFLFIRRYFTFIFFLVLQAVALWFLFTYNRFYRAKGMGAANQFTGWFNSKYNNVEDFFAMKEENRRLLRMNDSLMNLLPVNFVKKDTSQRITIDTIPGDTTHSTRFYRWTYAQVTYSTVNSEKNYIQINKGANQGVKDNMGVFSSDGGLVGKIVNVGSNYSTAMSLLHVQNNVGAFSKRSHSSGFISWDGNNPKVLTLTGIPKNDSLVKGDTILTGRFSLSFPPGYLIGTVSEVIPDNSTNLAILRIKPFANFSDLQQVMLVENIDYKEEADQMQETKKKVDEAQKNNKNTR